MTDDELLAWFEERENQKNDRVMAYLVEQGRPDLAKQLEDRIKTIRLGIDGAQSTWNALSTAQKNVMLALEEGAYLKSDNEQNTRFAVYLPVSGVKIGSFYGGTVRNVMQRELVSWAPDKKVILTERGRFVLKLGRGEPKREH